MVSSKCLPTLYLSRTRPSFTPIAVAPSSGRAGNTVADLLEFSSVASRSASRLCARSFANSGLRQAIESLVGILRIRELEQIALIEEPQLQLTGFDQPADLAAFQRGDPRQPVNAFSSPIALCEIMPRSPTSTIRSRPKDSLSFDTAASASWDRPCCPRTPTPRSGSPPVWSSAHS